MELDPERPSGQHPSKELLKQPFWKLFSRDEVLLYGYGALVYVLLGVLITDIVLNWIIGPLFIIVWVWQVPPLIDRWRVWREGRSTP